MTVDPPDHSGVDAALETEQQGSSGATLAGAGGTRSPEEEQKRAEKRDDKVLGAQIAIASAVLTALAGGVVTFGNSYYQQSVADEAATQPEYRTYFTDFINAAYGARDSLQQHPECFPERRREQRRPEAPGAGSRPQPST